jgi:hypothetical protein
VNTLYCLEEWRGKKRMSPPGDNFTPRGQITPLGDNWGSKFAPRGEVKNGPQGCQIFIGTTKIPKEHKMYQMAIKYAC